MLAASVMLSYFSLNLFILAGSGLAGFISFLTFACSLSYFDFVLARSSSAYSSSLASAAAPPSPASTTAFNSSYFAFVLLSSF